MQLSVGVHHPSHGLGVGAHVRSGYVSIGPDQVLDAQGVPSCEPVQLAIRKQARVHLDSALGPSVGKVNQGGFPGHQRRQASHLIEVGLGMIADTSLVWTTGGVVLHPGAAENMYLAIVQAHGYLNQQFPPRPFQHLAQPIDYAQPVGGAIEK